MEDQVIDYGDNLIAFPWINQEYLEKVIRDFKNDPEAIVHSFNVTPGSKPGENFSTVIFRIHLKFSSKLQKFTEISMILKTVSENDGFKRDMMQFNRNFETEIEMYVKVLPEVKNLWESVGDNSLLFPRLIYQSLTPRKVVILEDMCSKGFELGDKMMDDYENSKFVVQKLAKLHAGSFYMTNEKNIDLTHFDVCMFKFMPPKLLEAHFQEDFKILADVLKTWDGFEKYAPYVEALSENYLERIVKVYEPSVSGYNVLNHGDHHPMNEMFLKENGKIKEAIFLDYQISVFATPAIDLIYSLCVDISTENRQKYRDEYIRYYHEEFVKTLKSFGYLKKIPTLLDLQIEMLRYGFLETILIICLTLFGFVDWSDVDPKEIGNPETSRKMKIKAYNKDKYKEMIQAELPRLLAKGLL